ncbi:ferredoxin [Williamsia maris]|uniref:Ferredoxin n=1 Tax=Williamsia maris TaxID=72806 RepID=A0ABT1HJE4_9NOCA|nr:ferredoxin [Williamsia maris]MCP2178067.1 ferredoxin [Williamsia maris]
MAYVVTDACVDELDKSCVEECPVDCIYEGARMVYINPDECVDCGKCVPACPNDAIFWEHKIPADKALFVDIAVDFFDETEASGGAEDFGPVGRDHPAVAELGGND